jgi:hypothetical protein
MPDPKLPILAIDFDGVVHKYSDGWRKGEIYDTITPGFFDWALEAQKHFTLIIHSSRASTEFGKSQIRQWLDLQLQDWENAGGKRPIKIEITSAKPPAFLTIDDRCVRFDGHWDSPTLHPEALKQFKPWMTKMAKLPEPAT